MNQITLGTIFHRVVLVICVPLILASCADLSAVREWSKTSLEASLYNEIVTTYSDTPDRIFKYDNDASWKRQSEQRNKQGKALKEILSVVSDYMAALATLSAKGTIDYSKDVDGLKLSIKKLDAGISDKTLGSVGSIINTVLTAAAKGYQSRQIKEAIKQANSDLQIILKGELYRIVDSDFRRDLDIEKSAIDRYYDGQMQTGQPSDAAKVSVREWKEWRLQENARKTEAVDSYLKVLDGISKGHQTLFESNGKLDSAAVIKELLTLSNSLRKQIKTLSESN